MIVYNDKTEQLTIDEMHSIVASLYSPTLPKVGEISMYDNYCHGGKDWICVMDGKNAVEALRKFMEVMRLD
jgi:hypothetical protein